jgi:hypothetical protein
MFTWFVSLVMLFTNRGVIPTVPSAGLNTSGNGHVLHADDTGTNPTSPADVDGGHKPGGP